MEEQKIPLTPAEQVERRRARENSPHPELWRLLDEVKDPEIPVISIWELGILRDVTLEGDTVVVTITPTYSGCPAMDVIREEISCTLTRAGYDKVRVETRMSPAWTTAWMSEEGREKLARYGIAPPGQRVPVCPHCGASAVKQVSEFGSTACKALYTCRECGEPFDFFKNI